MFVHAQTFVDFEDGTTGPLTIHVMGCGEWDNDALHPVTETFMVIDNPDPAGINTSSKVMKFIRRGTEDGGMPWGGFWASCDPNADISVNKYVHVKVWKPRISPLKFKLEGGSAGTLETASMYAQTITGGWEDIVFDFTSKDGTYPTLALMPDFEDPLTATGVQEIYFDDIIFSDDPNPIGGSAPLMVTFEDGTAGALTLHVMGCGDWDNEALHPVSETFMVVDNPDADGINTSSKVMKFLRRGTDEGGLPWGGFWANCDPKNDITGNKYCHVKVWKPRISPLKFKIEGGSSGNLEIVSMNAQTLTGEWEDIVFDFTSKDGEYPVVAFMPDFEDPLTAGAVQEIYFDDIIFNNNPNPIRLPVPLMVDFEDGTAGALTLHVMGCGDYDNADLHPVSETFSIIDNPDPTGINTSSKVMQFTRRGTTNGGLPWGGFWANVDPQNDITDNKYCHVKVWKSRLSPIKFKIEGGPGGNLEIASTNTQDLTDQWQDMVFDFSTMASGAYPVVAFMPDFEDPLSITDDILIYFDDIIFNNDPNPHGTGIGKHNTIDVSIYPNPCNTYVNLSNNTELRRVEFRNVTGQVVISMEDVPAGQTIISTTGLINGIYIITVEDHSGSVGFSKVIVY